MEGAGDWDEMPCIVVKGVCDYADCHKHKGGRTLRLRRQLLQPRLFWNATSQTDKVEVASKGKSQSQGLSGKD